MNPIVWISGGWFLRGSSLVDAAYARSLCEQSRNGTPCPEELFFDEVPERRIWISAFGIDRSETTNAAYGGCVAAGRCAPAMLPEGDVRVSLPSMPVAGVSWNEARRYCAFVGGRLPTEAEWERAARGSSRRRFPWGDFYNPRLANHGRYEEPVNDDVDGHRFCAPVGSYRAARSPHGMDDMVGNVWEWTADSYDPSFYATSPAIDPSEQSATGPRVVRGGSWRSPSFMLRVTQRWALPESTTRVDVGFRCAYDSAD